jgi:predicted Rossmann fold flavoprotein
VLLETAKSPGAKILVSGGSRCNVTNATVSERDFWGGRRTIVRQILRAFPVSHTVAFFGELGVPLHEEADGKLFPDSNRSRDVLDALLRESRARGVDLRTDRRVLDVARAPDGFIISTAGGTLGAAAVVLATGGRSLPKSGSDGSGYGVAERLGHTLIPTTPGLAPLVLAEAPSEVRALHAELSGVAHEVELTVRIDGAAATRLTGALLWTHFGISGPVALNASRHWARAHLEGRAVALTANFCAGRSFDEVDAHLTQLAGDRAKASIRTALATLIPASVASGLLARLGIDAESILAHLSRGHRRQLAHALVAWPLPVSGTRGYTFAEVTAGGVALAEIDPASMESRACPGLYLIGEILDVDGRIGGFNFQWAWATAHVAARGLATAFRRPARA